ncbi:MAG: hypothetical protein AB1938_22660 [Myxococcota bacterium]
MNLHALLVLLLAGTASAGDRAVRVGFADVVALDDKAKDAAALLSPRVSAELVRSGREVVSSRDLSARGHSPEALRACPDEHCRKAAASLGMDYVLLASVSRLGRRYGLELKLVDPSAAKVLGERVEVASTDKELGSTMQTALADLLKAVPTRRAADAPALKSAPVVDAPPVTPTVEQERPVTAPRRWPGFVTAGAGAAVGVVGLVLVTTSLGFNQAKSELTFDEAQAARGAAQTQMIIGYSLIAAGLAGVGLGLWWALSAQPVKTTFLPLPGGAALAVAGEF